MMTQRRLGVELPHRLNICAALCPGTPVPDAAQAEGVVAVQQAELALRGFRLREHLRSKWLSTPDCPFPSDETHLLQL